jgi:aminopeptidase N
MVVPAAFAEAMGRVLTDGSRDPAFAAECLELPSEGYLAECCGVADPDAIHKARMQVIREIATRYRTRFEGAFRHFTVPGAYSPDAVARGGARCATPRWATSPRSTTRLRARSRSWNSAARRT